MRTSAAWVVAALMATGLAGCGDSCESVQDEIEQIGHEIGKDPESAWDRAPELQELGNKLQEMNCFGQAGAVRR